MLWDDLLTKEKHLAGFAVDDAHDPNIGSGGGWIMVKAKELTVDSFLEAIRRGCFYSTSGPTIDKISFSKGMVEVKCSPVKRINFIVDTYPVYYLGWSIHAPNRKTITKGVRKIPDEHPKVKYLCVRIEVVDEHGRKAWSNPFFL